MKPFKSIILGLLSFFSLQSFPQVPDWTDFNKRNFLYPKEQYYVAYYFAPIEKDKSENEQIQVLLGYAKSDIVENLVVSINSVSDVQTTANGKSFTQTFSQKSVSLAKAELAGLKTQTFKSKKELHVLAYIAKSDLVNYYQAKLSETYKKIEADLINAQQQQKEGKKELALNLFYQCQQQLQESSEPRAILLAVQKREPDLNFATLESMVRIGIETIVSTSPQNPAEAAQKIVEAINKQLPVTQEPIRIFSTTYQDSKLSGPFAAYFQKQLESKLAARGYKIDFNAADQQSLFLMGTYWKESDNIRIVMNLIDSKSSAVKASAEATLPESWFSQNQMVYLPENFSEAYSRMKAFSKDEIVSGGLRLDVWTNKGDANLLFKEDDTLKLYVRANHECYLRFIYYMADGSKVLLMDDYYISSDKVNKVIEIPDNFICAGPFGTESLVLNGQATPFDKLKTENRDGYQFILDDVTTIVAQSRGFKKASPESIKGEKRLTFTTMEK